MAHKALKRVSKARLVAISLFDLRDKASEIAVIDPALFLTTIHFDMSFLESAYDTMSSLDLPYENLFGWAETNMRQLEMLIDQEEFEVGYHYYMRPEECVTGINLLTSNTFTEQIDQFYNYPDCRKIIIKN